MTTYDLSSLRSYVAGGAPRSVPLGSVLLDVQHNLLQQRFVEIPFLLSWRVPELKDKVYQLTGSSPEWQSLRLDGKLALSDDNKSLQEYLLLSSGSSSLSPAALQGHFLFVEDRDPFSAAKGGALEDFSQVKKYEMSREDYEKRENTYLAYKKRMKEQDPNWKTVAERKREEAKQQQRKAAAEGQEGEGEAAPAESNEEVLARCPLGARCEIHPGARRGVIRYVGPILELSPGPISMSKGPSGEDLPVYPFWLGVELDEPVGKHDGIIHGKRYFQTKSKGASFVRPSQVKVGDFPERDPFDEDSEEEKDEEEEDLYEEL